VYFNRVPMITKRNNNMKKRHLVVSETLHKRIKQTAKSNGRSIEWMTDAVVKLGLKVLREHLNRQDA